MTDKLIDVYLGFMDEEVNTVLNGLLEGELRKDAAKRRPVVLIERGTVDPHGPLLEWPLERYAARPRNIAYARGGAERARSLQAPSDPDARVESMLARAMTIFLASDDTAEAKLREANVRVIRMIDVHELTCCAARQSSRYRWTARAPNCRWFVSTSASLRRSSRRSSCSAHPRWACNPA